MSQPGLLRSDQSTSKAVKPLSCRNISFVRHIVVKNPRLMQRVVVICSYASLDSASKNQVHQIRVFDMLSGAAL